MAINKSKTSVWMKTFIIVLIVAFISAFMYSGIAGLWALFQPTTAATPAATTAATADPVAAANANFKPGVDALTQAIASEPTSYTALVNLGNAYFDWAQTLSTPASGQSQATTTALAAAAPLWLASKDAYARAVKVKPGDPGVETDFAVVTFYSGETSAAITMAEAVSVRQPDFAQAWLNLGVFYAATGQTAKAIVAYEKYLKLDPKGQNVAFADAQLKSLKSGTTAP